MHALSTLAIFGLSYVSHAHMIMREPTPFGASKLASDNGPLKPDGSDFPCKVGYDAEGASNSMPLGSMQQLAFTGGATHGGGSCQVSITYDETPNSKSTFKVIHSIMGGCPARNTAGNIGESSTFLDPDTYAFKIPDNLPPGNAVLAWTWFNKVGNREMYMNCAPVKLVGSANKSVKQSNGTRTDEKVAAAYDSLPDMFVANIGNGCTTKDNTDLQFTDPGENVEVIASNALAGPVGNCAKSSSTPVKISPDAKPVPKPAPKSDPKPEPKPAPEPDNKSDPDADDKPEPDSGDRSDSKTSSKSDPKPGTFFSTSQTSPARLNPDAATSPAKTSSAGNTSDDNEEARTASSSSGAPKKPSTASTPSKGSQGTVSSVSNATRAGSACETEGKWNCIDEKSYQQCASGTWSVVMPLAAGTMCEKGVSDAIKVNAIKSRNIRFSTSHLRRHTGGSRNI
ncbi:unnamed protein product [Blumeria hordei]|uniref:Uncharacterized protein n=1 Tax=Blumeria hordei TaxID=2867405 RepID=A0A383UI02_BLUHO|nr:unnamed protein product [Blumeria hordei]